jgi:starch-binding outer membrane protein, SusD/RagB family
MKKQKLLVVLKPLALTLTIVLVVIGCNKDFLNTKPLDRISSDATWSDGALSQAFIFNVYTYLGYAGFEEQGLSAYTDEAMFTHAGRNINTFTEGTETPGNLAWSSPTYEWNNMYLAIRQANIAIDQLPKATFTDQPLKDKLLGEALFLRAYYYQQLLRFYGGVPLISKPYGLDEDYSVPRSSYEECVKFIVADLDKAADLLKGKSLEDGRTNRLAALALKARVLTYAASDLHDATKARARVAALGSYQTIDLVAYASGSQATRWEAARVASKAALDEAMAAGKGYKLALGAPVSAAEGRANYNAIAMGGKSGAADPAGANDLIWMRTHTALFTQESNWPLGGIHYGINNGPNGYNNWAGNTPVQNLVDDYEMMDGSKFDWNNAAHKAAPYENRDPRFYASIMYDGSNWKPRPPAVAGIDPANQIQTGFYDDGKGGTVNGVDTRESAVENWNGTRTGYYTRKFIDNDPALRDNQSSAQVIPFPFLRQTENVLNYVEACLNTGQEAEARTWLNRIRARAGMPPTTESGAALLARYQNERRIELHYEDHRYHDARRWLIAPTTVGRGIKSINVRATLRSGATANVPYRFDKAKYNYSYTSVDNTQNETRKWNDKMYYRPISRGEINRNTKLVQNPGY